jgi:branched-chain amino acid transport system substrate-binding protein
MIRSLRKFLTISFAAALLAGPACAQDTIKIGVTQPLTGAFAASGNYVAQGAKLAEDQINAAAACSGGRSN